METYIRNPVIYGAGGPGREIFALIRRYYMNEWNIVGFVVDNDSRTLLKAFLSVLSNTFTCRITTKIRKKPDAKQGITGWAQIHGRNATTWEERFKNNVWYVDNWSFWLDIKIVIMTVNKVLRHEGISAEGEATMPRFMENGGCNK